METDPRLQAEVDAVIMAVDQLGTWTPEYGEKFVLPYLEARGVVTERIDALIAAAKRIGAEDERKRLQEWFDRGTTTTRNLIPKANP